MWPTSVAGESAPPGWSALGRGARVALGVGTAVLIIATAVASWLSIRFGQPSTPVYNGSVAPASVWTWDGAGYSSIPVDGAGPYSNNADMAYDPAHGLLLLWDHGCGKLVMGFTGGCVDRANQTWTWDGRRWTAHSPKATPVEVGFGTMVLDGRLGQVVYVNGAAQAWSWNGEDWLPVAMKGGPRVPPPGSAAGQSTFAAGYDDSRRLLVLAVSGSTWTWDGSAWTEVRSGIDAGDARPDAHLAYDAARAQLVYVGKRFTWTWDGSSWQSHQQPPAGAGAIAYDPLRKALLMVQQDSSTCDRAACRTVTWSWDSTSWKRLPLERAPLYPITRSGAFDPPMAFDPGLGVVVLFASGA
jgi:hypothetical protein